MAEEQDTFKEIYDNLWGAHERELIYYKVMESTLKGGAGQQKRIMEEKDIRIKELEDTINSLSMTHVNTEEFNSVIKELEAEVRKLLEQIALDKLNAQDYARTIVNLEAQLRELQDWDSADMPNGERIYNTGRGMIQYPFNPEGEELYCMQCSGDEGYLDECICGVDDTPTPYPYTHPIRDIPNYSKVTI